ncbi:hypothetical protein LWC35_17220 [Pseudonocardia kujensis]|uniref:hypothetical protein n=1 Tax=Pseudonocardia kujensis TaxID=1128675 RepID=UPI001E50B569|nr:hypothetical protein [Pseudonocardia kujensis]MCE0764637.1 hypothetical protein [Pseudonocardia kujensis]
MVGRRGDAGDRLCVAVDLEGYGRRSDAGQERAQEALAGVLDRAWRAARTDALRQANGDGEVALLGPAAEPTAVVAMLVALRAGLEALNRSSPRDRLRLRAAAHRGPGRPARNGFAGSGVVRTCRFLGSRALRADLARRPGADLAVALSDPLFAELRGVLRVRDFRRVLVLEPAKVFSGHAWLHTGGPLPALPGAAGSADAPADLAADEPGPDTPGMRIEIADGGQAGTVVQARELHGGLTIGPPDRRGGV